MILDVIASIVFVSYLVSVFMGAVLIAKTYPEYFYHIYLLLPLAVILIMWAFYRVASF